MDLKYDSKIGRGAFGDVWRADDALLGRTVAVKFFNDAAPTQAEMNALSHAKALVRVDSPAVVRVLSLERQRHPESDVDCLAIIMEYVNGPSLSLHRGPFTTELALATIRDLSIAVEAIHSAGLVHGDLHDGNVLITPTGAKVVDILYTHSLAEVGSRTAARTRDDDRRSLAVLFRQIAEKSGLDAPSLEEAYYRATTAATTVSEMRNIFVEVLTAPSFRPSPAEPQQPASGDNGRRSTSGLPDEAPVQARPDPSAIIAKLQSGVVPLSACIADSLAFAATVSDQELKLLCERELMGYKDVGQPSGRGGPSKISQSEDVEHRVIQFYMSLGAEVNIDYFGSAQRTLAWMQAQPKEFPPFKFLYPEPIGAIERSSKQLTADKLISIRMPASSLVPNTNIPDALVICYAPGDAFERLLERTRTLFTGKLLRHMAGERVVTVAEERDNEEAMMLRFFASHPTGHFAASSFKNKKWPGFEKLGRLHPEELRNLLEKLAAAGRIERNESQGAITYCYKNGGAGR